MTTRERWDITSVTPSTVGASVSIAADGKSIVYTPAAGFTGTDLLEYTVDGQLKANVTVKVNATTQELYPKVESLDAFKELVLNAEHNNYWYGNPLEDVAFDGAEGGAAVRDHSETNVQVEGVDEADLIETDSDYIYTLTNGQLVITRAWPADQMEVMSRYDIKGAPIGQYLFGDRLTVISEQHGYFHYIDDVASKPRHCIAWRHRVLPGKQTNNLRNGARCLGSRESQNWCRGPKSKGPTYRHAALTTLSILSCVTMNRWLHRSSRFVKVKGTSKRVAQKRKKNGSRESRMIFASVVEEVLPNYESYGPDDTLARTGLLIEPEDIFHPLSEGASSLVTVAAINVTNNEPGIAATTGVLTTGGSQLYVTTENLYVFENHHDWQDEDLVDSPTTKILKFELDRESGNANFAASGQVPGSFLNQFSADEYDGHLRVATQVNNNRSGNYSGGNENALFVLQDDGGVLEPVGTLQNLAINESIQSVRFLGDRALITTFRSIDPLFSINLSDHTNPHVEGYLTLPGFSSYMQFVDEDHALTIGRSTGGGIGVTMISLFDVSDILQPVLVDQFNWGGFSRSIAETDHHAFGWFANHNTLAIPSVVSYRTRTDEDGDGYAEQINNVTDYSLNAFGIDTSHDTFNDDGITLNGTIQMDSPLLRSAYIDDKLYAVATNSIKSTNIASPNDVIAEVDISRPDVEAPEPVADPRFLTIADLAAGARRDLASAVSVREEQIMAVATETDEDKTRMLFRVGDEHFIYHGLGDQLEMERMDFRPVTSGYEYDWHNDANPLDTNNDGEVTPRDALILINMINSGTVGDLPDATVINQIETLSDEFKVDSNGDGQLTAIDVLRIINHLNGETEPAALPAPAPVDAIFAAVSLDDDDE